MNIISFSHLENSLFLYAMYHHITRSYISFVELSILEIKTPHI